MTALRGAWAAAVVLALVALPEIAAACPMCLSGQGKGSGRAFALGALMLSVIPLAVIGSAVWYLRRRARALGDPADARRDARPEPRIGPERVASSR